MARRTPAKVVAGKRFAKVKRFKTKPGAKRIARQIVRRKFRPRKRPSLF